MRHLLFEGPGRLHWREATDPVIIHDRDALVRPIAVARCDLDPAIAHGLYPMPAPFAMGHEMVGEIIELGDAGGAHSVGDQVIVPFQISCGSCGACGNGYSNACESVPPGSAFGLGPHGGIDHGGALADVVRVPYADHMLIPLPDGLDPVVAAGIPDNIADGYRCVAAPLARHPGSAVLVVAGLAPSVGLYATAVAIALGSRHVRYVDHDHERLEIARSLGADVLDVPLDDLAGSATDQRFPITVDASVYEQGRNYALQSTAPCGSCTSVSGGVGRHATLPLQQMYLKGVTYDVGRVHARATAPAVLDLITAGHLDPRPVTTRVVPFADAAEAMFEPATKLVFTNS